MVFDNSMNAISFTATPVKIQTERKPSEKEPTVRERQLNGRYKDKDTVFLKVSKTRADKKALRELSKLWDYECNFVSSIVSDREYYPEEDKTIYLISEQKENFRKIDYKKVLGIAELTKNKRSYKLNFIQARPDCISSKKLRPFKNIGDVMMNRIIDLTGEFRIYLNSLPEVIEYYKRFGYKVIQDDISAPLMVLIKRKKF